VAVVVLVLVFLAILWIASLISVITNPGNYRNGTQLIWVLVLLLLGPIGALLYQSLGAVRAHESNDGSVERERDRHRLLGPDG
jgi:hypothetical protein